jgi:hypothetical protein
VKAFHQRLGLETVVDLDILIKGAKIVKEQYGELPPGLTPAEMQTLMNEASESSLSFLQTRGLLVTIMTTACAAITQYVQQPWELVNIFK